MTDVIAIILGAGGLIAYLYRLYNRYQQALNKIAQAEAQAKIKTDLEKVAQDAKLVDEKVIDFNDAAANFERNNPGGKG